eukprot:8767318-Lingulodinium_polyedra.AAC.1
MSKHGAMFRCGMLLAWLVGTANYRHSHELRASGKLVVRDDVASDIVRLVGYANVAVAAAVTEGNEYTH